MTTRRTRVAAFALVLSAFALLIAATGVGAKTVWLCKPGIKNDPCEPKLDTTLISPAGESLGTKTPKADKKPKIDCFYVYPTVSDDQTRNSDRSIDPEERSIALYQAARYSQYCRVYAPMYRQFTIPALLSGQTATAEEGALAYGDVAAEADLGGDRQQEVRTQAVGVGDPARRKRPRRTGPGFRWGLRPHPGVLHAV
jgi:hypothetical protein